MFQQKDEHIKANENIRYLFIKAMMDLNEKAIFCLLNENSCFFGIKYNWQLIYFIKRKFKGLMESRFLKLYRKNFPR